MSFQLHDFFPPIEPYAKGMLRVDDLHTLYWEECGNPEGVPVIFLHGGPGAGASPTHRRFFDPAAWRIVIFDQRGAGRSEPLGETRNNTTELLIQDIETLRKIRGIERWHVFGGSWGSTLALAYAETHPERCLGLILRSISLFRKTEISWFLYDIRNVFPEAWKKFVSIIPPEERHDLLAAYQRIFECGNENRRLEACRNYTGYEDICATLAHSPDEPRLRNDRRDIGMAMLEVHYFRNNMFVPETRLLDNIARIRPIPGVIVHGRYDMICPIMAAEDLHRAWPQAEYRIINDAGHSAMEPGIRSALIEATEKFKAIKV